MALAVPSVPDTRMVDSAGYSTSEFRIFLEELRNNVVDFKFTQKLTTTGGGTTETFSLKDVLVTDQIIAQVTTSSVGGLRVEKSRTLTDQIEISFNADPGANTVVTSWILTPIVENKFS